MQPEQAEPSVADALSHGSTQLQQALGEALALDVELLLAQAMGESRSHLYAWPDKALKASQWQAFCALLERRQKGEPLAYILGSREFWSLDLRVTPDTLIPRPETELLVETALDLIPRDQPTRIADLGTGSGAIALAIASERPRCRVVGVDSSQAALMVAHANAERLGIDNVVFARGSWLEPLVAGATFDLIVSNPPYVADRDPHLLEDGLPWEPQQALTSGADGLDDIRTIIRDAKKHLKPGSYLILEHGFEQAAAVRELFRKAGYQIPQTSQDLQQQDRLTGAAAPSLRRPETVRFASD